MRWLTSMILVVGLCGLGLFLGRLPLGIETSFADGSSKSWRFVRGPDASGTLEGAGGARGVRAVLKDSSTWKAVAADTLGNVLALAGTSGDFTRRTFDPWGNPLTRDASGNLRASTLQERRADYDALPLAWASQEVDPDTGLTHYHFREYSPSLGGWLTRDPIGLAGGYLNLRSYLGNRPADELDVWGEGSVDDQLLGFKDGWNNQASADAQDDSPYYKGAYGVGSIYGVLASRQYWEGVGQGVAITAGVCTTIATAGLAVEAGAVLWAARAAGPVTAATMAAQRASQNGLPESLEALALPPGAAPSRPSGSALLAAEGRTAQAAGKTAAKQSVAATTGTQADALKLKVIEEAKKCRPCSDAANKTIHPLRQQYIEEVLALEELGLSARAAGADVEAVARMLHAERRAIGLKYKDLTTADELARITQRNITKYGDAQGPSIDWLRSQGKTWEQIIESAARPDGKDLGY